MKTIHTKIQIRLTGLLLWPLGLLLGAPEAFGQQLDLHPDSLFFSVVELGKTKSLSFTVTNEDSDNVLEITNITSSSAAFVPGLTAGTILPGDSVMVRVDFMPAATIDHTDSLSILSNDADEPEKRVFLFGSWNRIASLAPPHNAIGVEEFSEISVTFVVDMDPATINAETFLVYGERSGYHSGSYTYNSATKTATFVPTSQVEAGELVNVTLARSIRSIANETLPAAYSWRFTMKPADGSGLFTNASQPSAQGQQEGAAAGDFDGDGHLDLAVTNINNSRVVVLRNNGKGKFQVAAASPTGSGPTTVATGDFDSDGDLDLAVANQFSEDISILANSGSGTFGQKQLLPAGRKPSSLAAIDFTGEGRLDLVVTEEFSNTLTLLKNDGSGTFAKYLTVTSGSNPRAAHASDFDGDGTIDIAVINVVSSEVAFFKNNGRGNFVATAPLKLQGSPESLAGGDFDGDGDVDLAIGIAAFGKLLLLRNDGAGNFTTLTQLSVGSEPISTVAADLDGDGDLDLAVLNNDQDNVLVFKNDGAANFIYVASTGAGESPWWLVPGDFDGDRDIDLAVTDRGATSLTILMNRNRHADLNTSVDSLRFGSVNIGAAKELQLLIHNRGVEGTLQITSISSANPAFVPNSTALAIPPDEVLALSVTFTPAKAISYKDTLVLSSNDPNKPRVYVYLFGAGHPISSYTPAQNRINVPIHSPIAVVFAEAMDPSTITAKTFLSRGSFNGNHTGQHSYEAGTKTARFVPDKPFKVGETVEVTLTPGIKNATGEAISRPYSWSFVIQSLNGSGQFLKTGAFDAGTRTSSLTVGDFDNDGDLDLAAGSDLQTSVSILKNDGNGNFSRSSKTEIGGAPRTMAAGDLDNDGDLDLATANYSSDFVSILQNDGNGVFIQKDTIILDLRPATVVVNDWDGDGDLDLAVTVFNTNETVILANNGNSEFTQAQALNVAYPAHGMTSGDFDSDGDFDLAVTTYFSNKVAILSNDGSGSFSIAAQLNVWQSPQAIWSCDLDGDHDLDLIIAHLDDRLLSLHLNDGAGNFLQSYRLNTALESEDVAIGDFEGDGDLDLAVGSINTVTKLAIFANDGHGLFEPAQTFQEEHYPNGIAAGDYDGDGDLDLAIGLDAMVAVLKNGTKVDVEDESTSLPKAFQLHQNYPNPFSPITATSIRYDLPYAVKVDLKVYDVLGKEVRTLVPHRHQAGIQFVQWDATNNAGKRVRSGVYFLKIKAASYQKIMKMLLLDNHP